MASETDRRRPDQLLRTALAVYLVLLVLALFPYTGDPAGDIKRLITSWAACVIGGGWCLSAWLTKPPLRRPPLFFTILLGFLGLNLAASFLSNHPHYGLTETRRYAALIILYLVTSQVVHTTGHLRRLLTALCAAMGVAAAYAFLQKLGIEFFPWANRTSDEYINLPSTFGNPNYAAHTLILCIIMALYLATTGPRLGSDWRAALKKRLPWAGLVLAFALHLYFTRQRAGLIALAGAAVLVCVAWTTRRIVRRPAKAAVLSLLVTAIIGAAGCIAVMGLTKSRTGTVYPLDLSLLVRYKSYVSASKMALSRPLLGYGPGAYKLDYPPFWTPYEQEWFARELKMNAHVHNDPIEIAIDAGAPAAALYLTFLVFGMGYGILLAYSAQSRDERRAGHAFAAFFAAFFIDGCFGFNLRVPVSAALLFVMAGAFEGLAAARSPAALSHGRRLIPLAVAIIALLCAVGETRLFASEFDLQKGKSEAKQRNDAAAIEWFRKGEARAPWGLALRAATGFGQRAPGRLSRRRPPFRTFPRTQSQLHHHPRRPCPCQAGYRRRRRSRRRSAPARARRSRLQCREGPRTVPGIRPGGGGAGTHRVVARHAAHKQREQTDAQKEATKDAWQCAETHFTRAIQFGAKNQAGVYKLLARVRLGLGDEEGAEKALIRAAQAEPADESIWPFFHEFAKRTGRIKPLQETLLGQIRRLSETPGSDENAIAGAYRWLAEVYEAAGDIAAAEDAFLQALRHAPRRPGIWAAYAQFANRSDRLDAFNKEVAASCQALAAEGRQPLTELSAVTLFLERGLDGLPDAASLLTEVLKEDGGSTRARDARWAADYLLTEARHAPTHDRAGNTLFSLGIFYGGIGDMAAADGLFPSALPQLSAPERSAAAQHWAQLLAAQGRTREAVALLSELIERSPQDYAARLALARIQASAGRPQRARKEYEQIIEATGITPELRDAAQRGLDGLSSAASP